MISRQSLHQLGANLHREAKLLDLSLELPPQARWSGYDGAGDVEQYSEGWVRFVDLTIPLALPRADWVVSLEARPSLDGRAIGVVVSLGVPVASALSAGG